MTPTRGSERDIRRPLRDGVDGDDVWPVLTASELEVIGAIDRAVGETERADGPKPEVTERLIARLGVVALHSFAERVRHYRDLVADLEHGVATDEELRTELGCRSIVERLLGQLPVELRARLQDDVIGPLDHRFVAATIDDGGAYLREHFGRNVGTDGWWWSRRPGYLTDRGPST